MSKWGIEEKETLDAINNIGFCGKILNLAAGDGRFNDKLLEIADHVVAVDISAIELKQLNGDCFKLTTQVMDITQTWPFDHDSFDGVFCTGTLHLFDQKTIIKILKEITRVVKKGGKIVLDFATDIRRLNKNHQPVIFDTEGSYHLDESINFFYQQLKDFNLDIDHSVFEEDHLDDSTGYQMIKGNFLIICGVKK